MWFSGGGRVRLLVISKRDNTYLRTLPIHSASAVLTHANEPGAWIEQLLGRPWPVPSVPVPHGATIADSGLSIAAFSFW